MTHAWVYGLLRCPDLAMRLDRKPIDGMPDAAPVKVADLGAFQLAWSPIDRAEVPQRRRYLKGHARVLEELMPHGALLPFRFGHIARDLSHIASLVALSATEIEEQFSRIEGMAEIGVRIEFDREAALAAMLDAAPDLRKARDRLIAAGGNRQMDIAELGRQVAERLERRRTESQSAALKVLGKAASNQMIQVPESDVQVLRAAFLVPNEKVSEFADLVEKVAAEDGFAPGPGHVRLVHPTPPFHFVSLGLGGELAVA